MRVGFASDNGTMVNECLLSETTWWIYDIDARAELVDKRAYSCGGNCEACGRAFLTEFQDCDLLFVRHATSGNYLQLVAKGIQLLEASSSIKELLPYLTRCAGQHRPQSYYKRIFQVHG